MKGFAYRPLAMIALVLAAGNADAREVYKCVTESATGEQVTVLSDRPCAPDAQTVTARASPPAPADKAAAHSRLKVMETNRRLQQAADAGKVLPGMNETLVIKAWGRPDRKNLSTTERRERDQWVYRRANRTDYVYFEDGEVTSTSANIDVQPVTRARLLDSQ